MDNTQNYKDLYDASALMLGKMVAENAILRVRLNSPKPDVDQSLNLELQRLKAENDELAEVVCALRSRLDEMPKVGGLLGEAYAKIGELEARLEEAEALIPWIKQDNYIDRPGQPKPSVAQYIDLIARYKAKYPDAKIVDRR